MRVAFNPEDSFGKLLANAAFALQKHARDAERAELGHQPDLAHASIHIDHIREIYNVLNSRPRQSHVAWAWACERMDIFLRGDHRAYDYNRTVHDVLEILKTAMKIVVRDWKYVSDFQDDLGNDDFHPMFWSMRVWVPAMRRLAGVDASFDAFAQTDATLYNILISLRCHDDESFYHVAALVNYSVADFWIHGYREIAHRHAYWVQDVLSPHRQALCNVMKAHIDDLTLQYHGEAPDLANENRRLASTEAGSSDLDENFINDFAWMSLAEDL